MARSGKTLLVTNDFPPRVGGIQSYLRDFVDTQDPEKILVFASTQNAEEARVHDANLKYSVIRWPRPVMLPTPSTAEAMAEIIKAHDIETVWFGAAAPLGLMAQQARAAGASRIIASTHGHEVGWSMLPGARQLLRRIGDSVDIVTYISEYTLSRFRSAFGQGPEFVHLPSGVDVEKFHPISEEERATTRAAFDLAPDAPIISCISRLVPRKGQDSLIAAMPEILKSHPNAVLVIVGSGRYEKNLRRRAQDLGESVKFTGRLEHQDMINVLASSDIFAMPARTRGKGLDVEGLGIVYLEAQACGVPVVAGKSGGAPETVTPATGVVVDGRDVEKLAQTLKDLLVDASLRARMAAAGRNHVETAWTWKIMGERLRQILQL